MKKLMSIVLIVLFTIGLSGCGDLSPEQKKVELQKSSEALTAQLKKLDDISTFWKETWAELGANKINRVEGKQRMDFIFEKSMEVSRNINKIDVPGWMQKEQAERFKQTIKTFDLAANELASGAKNAVPLMTKDKPSQYEMDTVLTNGKNYQGFIIKGAAGFAAFKSEHQLQ